MLEQLVRPFESNGTIVSTRVIPSRNKVATEPVQLIWGAVGTLTAAREESQGGGLSFTVKDCDQTHVEDKAGRVTQNVNIHNKDDPTQTITVQRIKEIKFSKPGKNTQSESYVAFYVTQAMKDFDAAFNAGIGPDKCQDTYKLNWS